MTQTLGQPEIRQVAIPGAISAAKTPARRWWLPFVLILLAHMLVDTYSNLVPGSLGLFRKAWNLTDIQSAWLLGVGSLSSGLAQPTFAWISDRTDSRIFGGLGLALSAAVITSLGAANGSVQLFAFYVIGMLGVGMFHPIGASTIGQISPAFRSKAVSAFFVAGMAGQVSGALIGPRLLTTENGFGWLPLLMIPGLLVAIFLHRNIVGLDHRPSKKSLAGLRPQASAWSSIGLLYFSSTLRFAVNMSLVFLFVQWMESIVAIQNPSMSLANVTDKAAPLAGNMNAAMIVGMAVGGFSAGFMIPAGREKWPMVLVPIIFAPCIGFFPYVPSWFSFVLACGAGIAFASMVPVTMALAQRLIPHRSSLASGMMLGGAWAIAMIGPAIAQMSIERQGIEQTFILTAGVLAISGVVLIPLKDWAIRQSAEVHY